MTIREIGKRRNGARSWCCVANAESKEENIRDRNGNHISKPLG